MIYNKDEEFETFRQIYINNLNNKEFPWEPSYYYYTMHIGRIDIMSFQDFKDNLLAKNSTYATDEERWKYMSEPMYEELDKYYEPKVEFSKDNETFLVK